MKNRVSVLQTFVVVFTCLIITACGNRSGDNGEADNEQFYPVAEYIHSQLNHLDTLPLAIIKYKTANGITDTSIVTKPEFRKVAGSLIQADVSIAEKKKLYKETSLIDATLGTLSLIYTPIKNNVEVTQLNVLLRQQNGTIQSIYADVHPSGDSISSQKLLWTAQRNFQVTTLLNKTGKEEIILEKYVWDEITPIEHNH